MTDSPRVRTDGSGGDRPHGESGGRISLFWRTAAVFVAVTVIWLVIQYVSHGPSARATIAPDTSFRPSSPPY